MRLTVPFRQLDPTSKPEAMGESTEKTVLTGNKVRDAVIMHADHGSVVEGRSAAWPDRAAGHSFWAARGAAARSRPAPWRILTQLDITSA